MSSDAGLMFSRLARAQKTYCICLSHGLLHSSVSPPDFRDVMDGEASRAGSAPWRESPLRIDAWSEQQFWREILRVQAAMLLKILRSAVLASARLYLRQQQQYISRGWFLRFSETASGRERAGGEPDTQSPLMGRTG